MPKGYSLQAQGVLDGSLPPAIPDGAIVGARLRRNSIFLSGASLVAQGVGAVNDNIVVYEWPANALFDSITFQTDTAFTGATIQFGTAANPTKYGSIAAAAANTLYTLRPVAARIAGQYTAPEQLIMTVIGAALPSAFNAEIAMTYQSAN
ncbi:MULTISPECIES: hypothetical protein [Novosphingobium]|uniref:hypothetical protein n=1 Tax=Novosphingobium TaxID=165696 RepID=UPI000D30E3D5|nr:MULTISPECIES: hypothetical protein [Novosphingobium]PTR07870.1 hypothetical protein C8K11_11381 [Novosphingobium sp. GV055]PUB00683.1 hypothetical protein C8K12_11381 [Novosphingobium sp. GV061]PUB16092.1 hypothetical protein C8K14_11381 [Novosphingobium sp. GV079]PUB39557.1 hypothetical protein C8K10_11381 [Novosphingobium sp. GV027]WQD93773.1 hypothetical protein U0041_04020 [Novosphingobium capsulatum]